MKEITTSCYMKQVGSQGFIYVLKNDNLYKIGRSISNPKGRIKQHKKLYPNLKIINIYKINECIETEYDLQCKFRSKRINKTEWFELSKNEFLKLKRILSKKQKKFYAEQ